MKLKHTFVKNLQLSAVALAIAAGSSPVSFAQDAQNADSTITVEEMTVTARKREESILEVPIALTAFGEAEIEALDLGDIADVQLFTPGFVYEAYATTPGRFDQSPRFRGVDNDTGDVFRQTSSVFVDGLFIVNGASGISLDDIERVEVIKGPQSAYFGRNTFGGAVNYISKTPGDEFAGKVSASFATLDDYEVTGSVESPLVPGVLSGRVSGSYHSDGGHYDNHDETGVPIDGEKLGDEETWSVAGSLYFTPNDRLSAKLRASYFENDDGAPAIATVIAAQHNCGPFAASSTRTLFCGALPVDPAPGLSVIQSDSYFDALDSRLPLQGARDEMGFDRQNLTLGASFDYDLSDNIVLSGLFGYSQEDTNLLLDFDGRPQTIFNSVANREFDMNSQELRLSGIAAADRLNWLVGVSRFDQTATSVGGFIFGANPTPLASEPAIGEGAVETVGVFGSLSYDLTNKVTITAEGRYQEDEVTTATAINLPTGEVLEGTFDNFLPRIILDYQATDSTLLYASYSEGNNPGGFNREVRALSDADRVALSLIDPLVSESFDEETLKNFEVGVKHGFADGKGSVQAALFAMERTDQTFRTSVTDPTVNGGATVTYNLNRGVSDIVGAEFEGDFQLTDWLNIGASYGYLEGRFDTVADTIFLATFGTLDASGQNAIRYPKHSGSVSVLIEDDFGTGLPLYFRADASLIGQRFADITNVSFADGGNVINLRAGLNEEDYSVELFVKNALDSNVFTGVNRTSDAFTFFTQYAYRTGLRDKRQVGVRISRKF